MSEFQSKREVPKVGRLSDPLFKSPTWTRATSRLTYDEINILISLILHDRNQAVLNALAYERRKKGK